MGNHHQPTAHDAARRRDTATLIARLPHDVPPVPRLWSPPVRLASWLALEVLIAGCALLVLGERPDLAPRLASPGFATQSDCSSRPEWRARCCFARCRARARAGTRAADRRQRRDGRCNRDAPRERPCEPAGKRRGARGLAVRGPHARGRRRAMGDPAARGAPRRDDRPRARRASRRRRDTPRRGGRDPRRLPVRRALAPARVSSRPRRPRYHGIARDGPSLHVRWRRSRRRFYSARREALRARCSPSSATATLGLKLGIRDPTRPERSSAPRAAGAGKDPVP